MTSAERLAAVDAFLCEHGLLKAEDPGEGDALFLTPGGYWEPRECDDVGDHVDAIKKLLEWAHEGGFFDGLEHWRQRARSNQARELVCQRCGHDYDVWYAPNETWNAVVRNGLIEGGEQVEVDRNEHFLCPTCFTMLAKERGYRNAAWVLALDDGPGS